MLVGNLYEDPGTWIHVNYIHTNRTISCTSEIYYKCEAHNLVKNFKSLIDIMNYYRVAGANVISEQEPFESR